MSIYVGEPKIISISDMQGPCPDGFHVPLKDEWDSLYNAFTGLGLSGSTNWSIYLKMPFAGYRSYYTSDVNNQGSHGRYWSSMGVGDSSVWNLYFLSSGVYPHNDYGGSNGSSIRGFKNEPVVPDSSRTTLYQGSGNAGIFWNSSLGLISVSSDGSTWYTIMDKNLGATTVYNGGDTLSEANCGYYYQWGNNYGFPRTGSVTTSTSQVNASTYGPGNYYNSSTFLIIRNYPYSWDSANSKNLWGGVSQGTSTTTSDIKHIYIGANEAKEVYVGTDKVRGQKIINFATQGPCPDDFHVPLLSEINALKDAVTGLGLSFSPNVYLKMPLAGLRDTGNGNVVRGGQWCRYWSSTSYNDSQAYLINESSVSRDAKGRGGSIRAFKNTSVTPDSSRTTISQGSGSAGIFHSPSLGLISVSSDGTNRVTIADKNLGATTVYNNGDTLSEANCGGFFQWGNNYMFPYSGSVTTSSTRVNASSYGPGNYYSSSTFITTSSTPYNWDSSGSTNLRGGVDGNVPVS